MSSNSQEVTSPAKVTSPTISTGNVAGTPTMTGKFKGLDSNSEGLSTPKNRILDVVKGTRGSQGSQSPVLKIPATPAMERLGFGTGVGVFLLQRTPRRNNEPLSPWAIKKTVKVADNDELFSARLEYEAKVLKELSHPNIIGYRAFGSTAPDKTFLAMEKGTNSLADLIEDRASEYLYADGSDSDVAPYPAKNMEKVALDVANALTYLHNDVKLVHGDLKAANVLVFGDFETIKLCDFGVSRKLKDDGTVEGHYVGTDIWNAMEVIQMKRGNGSVPVTYKADMYSFGLVIHEMITLKPPHFSNAEDSYLGSSTADTSSADESIEAVFDEDAFEAALQRCIGTRPLLPDVEFDDSYNTILGVFFCCTDEDPQKRPDAKVVVEALTF